MGGILVTAATPDRHDFERIIRRIADIGRDLAYRDGDARGEPDQASFLLSDFGIETYRKFAKAGQLQVVLKDDESVAFAVVYPPKMPADDPGTRHIRAAYGDVPVVKQVATAPGHGRRGYSRLLYRHFAEQYPALPLFAAIAEQPRNYGSENFHSKLGFVKCATFSAHPDGRERGIWRCPAIVQRP